MVRYALEKDYDNLLPTMEKVGFIQKGEQVSPREIDDMLRQYVEPLEVEVFHYTRKWLQRMTAMQHATSAAAGQIKAARQMDIPAKLAIPMRVIASDRRDLVPARRAHPDESPCHGIDSGIRRLRQGPNFWFPVPRTVRAACYAKGRREFRREFSSHHRPRIVASCRVRHLVTRKGAGNGRGSLLAGPQV